MRLVYVGLNQVKSTFHAHGTSQSLYTDTNYGYSQKEHCDVPHSQMIWGGNIFFHEAFHKTGALRDTFGTSLL